MISLDAAAPFADIVQQQALITTIRTIPRSWVPDNRAEARFPG
jgi:hypothetical protein